MPHVSLYRKYRPQTFEEILGQDHVATTLANAITEDRVAHAYLFTGPRGTGKTSTARILAKALNCAKGPTPSPCGVCDSCVAITEGSSLDVIEMDAASHSKVEETRDILAGVPLATAGSRKKVYVIDEVHMLSTSAFNALLKTLEEPPGHVLFVLATTEPHKVPATIVSRTQRFDFRRVSADVLEHHLAQVAKAENIDIDADALAAIARNADGGVRDALSMLDQVGSWGDHVGIDEVGSLVGNRTKDAVAAMYDAIGASSLEGMFGVLGKVMREGADARQLATELLAHGRTLLFMKTTPEAEWHLEASPDEIPALAAQAQRFSTSAITRVLDLVARAWAEMRNVPNHRLLLEVALVRAAAPETDPDPTGLLARIERLERRIGMTGAAPAEVVEGPEAQTAAHAPASEARPAPDAVPPVPEKTPTRPAAKTAVPARPAAKAAAPAPEAGIPRAPATEPAGTVSGTAEASPAPASVPAAVGLGHIKEAWPATMQEVSKRSRRVGAFLNPSNPLRLVDDVLTVEVQSGFHADAMAEEKNRSLLGEALYESLGVRPRFEFVERGAQPEPAAEDGAADESVDAVDATEDLDPVALVRDGLGAEVVDASQWPDIKGKS